MTGLTALNFNDFDKLFVGFDRLHNELTRRNEQSPLTNYPRYNLVAIGEDAYRIEMALPGWKRTTLISSNTKTNLPLKVMKNKN